MRGYRFQSLKIACIVMLLLLASLPGGAQRADASHSAQLFVAYCAACHGVDGGGGDKAPTLVSPSRAAVSDADLARVIHEGTREGMPPFAQLGDANIDAIIQYLRTLQGQGHSEEKRSPATLPGDPASGRNLYFGKAQCSRCHMLRGAGGFIAAGLTNYARNRAPEAILQSIIHPDQPLVRSSRVAKVVTLTGEQYTGVLRNEDNFTIDLQTEDGLYHMWARNDLAKIEYTDHSLMPRDYSTRLTTKELNDIVSLLIEESVDPTKRQAH